MKESFIRQAGLSLIIINVVLWFMGGAWLMQSELEMKEKINQAIIHRNDCPPTYQVDSLTEWEVLQMAIVMTESNFNPAAVGKNDDWGIFQQVPVYVAECNRILELRKEEARYVHEDSFDVDKAIQMFNLLQSHHNPEKDADKAIYYQNKASWYKKRVQDNITFIRQMEIVRKSLKDNQGILWGE